VNKFNAQKAITLLSNYRMIHYSNSFLTYDLGKKLIESHSSSVGNDIWDLNEQVCVAALDCGFKDEAMTIYKKLLKKFKNSFRIRKLQGLILEFSGQFSEATEVYKMLREENPSDTFAFKRLISIARDKKYC